MTTERLPATTPTKALTEVEVDTRLRAIEGEPDACDILVRDGPVMWVFHISRVMLQYGKLHTLTGLEWIPVNADAPLSFPIPRAGLSPIHVDWRSGSSIDSFQGRAQKYFDPGKTFLWSQNMQFAAQRLNEFLLQVGDLQSAEYVEVEAPEYNIYPIWPRSNRPVIWYGQGETGKGQIYHAAALALTYGTRLASMTTKQLDKGLVIVDYEDSQEEFNIRATRIANGMDVYPNPLVRRFDPMGRLFVEIADQLKAKVQAAGGCDGYIIDSAIPACGGDVMKPEPVGAFFSAIARLGKPVIIIAHETKDQEHADSPFGSQLWRTSAAMTVNFQGAEEAQQNTQGHWVRDLLIRCTKANNVRRFPPLALQLVFTDDEATSKPLFGNKVASTWIRQIDPTTVSTDLLLKLDPLRRLIAWMRSNEDATVSTIAAGTGMDAKKVSSYLTRNMGKYFAADGGGRGRGNAAKWRVIDGGQH